jgi:hypothetical protein
VKSIDRMELDRLAEESVGRGFMMASDFRKIAKTKSDQEIEDGLDRMVRSQAVRLVLELQKQGYISITTKYYNGYTGKCLGVKEEKRY